MDSLATYPDLPKAIDIQLSSINLNHHQLQVSLFNTSSLNPLASGNKLFKLTPNFKYALTMGYTQILSFGGAYSNHIYALASFGHAHKIQTIGVIRGEPEYANNPTLKKVQSYGMQLIFIDRQTYRLRHSPAFLKKLAGKYPHAYIVPEGGTNQHAVNGCIELAKKINSSSITPIDILAVACGSGGTLAGLACGLEAHQSIWGFPVVRDGSLKDKIDHLITDRPHVPYQLISADYGRYAKFDQQHLDFILNWLDQTGILLDPIYTSKMCRRLIQMIKEDDLKKSLHIGLIHTGGLQAWYGMQDKVIRYRGVATWDRIKESLNQ